MFVYFYSSIVHQLILWVNIVEERIYCGGEENFEMILFQKAISLEDLLDAKMNLLFVSFKCKFCFFFCMHLAYLIVLEVMPETKEMKIISEILFLSGAYVKSLEFEMNRSEENVFSLSFLYKSGNHDKEAIWLIWGLKQERWIENSVSAKDNLISRSSERTEEEEKSCWREQNNMSL